MKASRVEEHNRRGFTLIELSIVLIIVGLIAGGVLVGREMIRAATIKSLISDIDKFKTGVTTFQLKYDCLPGDCVKITSFLGTDPQCAARDTLTTGSCNGDGNNIISESAPTNGNNYYHMETFGFWQQLSAAGMIPGKYTGLSYTGNNGGLVGTDLPASRFSDSCYSIMYAGLANNLGQNTNGILFTNYEKHFYYFGRQGPSAGSSVWCGGAGGPLTSAEALSVDTKIDDGMPMTGGVVTSGYQIINGGWTFNPCITAVAPLSYTGSNDNAQCMLMFSTGF